jgi:exodeoxyribonuclease V gamma subunit
LPFSFDPTARAGAAAILNRLASPARSSGLELLITEPLPEPPGQTDHVDLGDLRSFYDHPVRHFVRRRLSITLPEEATQGDDQLPTSLDKLTASGIGGDLLEAGIALDDPESVIIPVDDSLPPLPEEVAAVLRYHRARGILPPPSVADPDLAAMSSEVADILKTASGFDALGAADQSHSLEVLLPDGTRVTGTVSRCGGGTDPGPLRLQYSRFKPKYLASAAIDLLLLTAAQPEVAWRGVVITRGESKNLAPKVWVRTVSGNDASARRATALRALEVLVTQYRDGACYPLPLFNATSYALINGANKTSTSRSAARKAWGDLVKNDFSWSKECFDLYHQLVFGPIHFDDLEAAVLGGHTLQGEADRLWGTLDAALVEVLPEDTTPPQGDRR